MIQEMDGAFVETEKLTCIEIAPHLHTDGDYYTVRFCLFDKDIEGKTRYDSEEECTDGIRKLVNGYTPDEMTGVKTRLDKLESEDKEKFDTEVDWDE